MIDGFVFERGLWTTTKDAEESLDYTGNFTKWLGADGVIDGTPTVTSAALTVSGVSVVAGGKAVSATLSGGTPGQDALVRFAIMSGARKRVSTVRVKISQRP